jgi:hypothetical protein
VSGGVQIKYGGIVDSDLANTQATLGAERPIAARVLLAEALHAAHFEKIWTLRYDPVMKSYSFGSSTALLPFDPGAPQGASSFLPTMP